MRPNRRAISRAARNRPTRRSSTPGPTRSRIAAPLLGDGNGWSRLTDGDLKSYWKSNPYLTKAYTGEDDSLHPQWVMIDLGAKVDVNAIKIAWADPYAKRYYVQFWTGELEPFYDGINKGAWQTFPMGTITDGKGGTPTLEAGELEDPGAVPAHLDDGIVQHLRHARRRRIQRNCVGYAINELYIGTVSGRRPVHRCRQAPARAGSRPSPGPLRWIRGMRLPTWTTEEATRSDSISSSIAA